MSDWLDGILNNPNDMSKVDLRREIKSHIKKGTKKKIARVKFAIQNMSIVNQTQEKNSKILMMVLKEMESESYNLRIKYFWRAVGSLCLGFAFFIIFLLFNSELSLLQLFLSGSSIIPGILKMRLQDLFIPLFSSDIIDYLDKFSFIVILIVGFLEIHSDEPEVETEGEVNGISLRRKRNPFFDFILGLLAVVFVKLILFVAIFNLFSQSKVIYVIIIEEGLFSIIFFCLYKVYGELKGLRKKFKVDNQIKASKKGGNTGPHKRKEDTLFDISHGPLLTVSFLIIGIILYVRIMIISPFFDNKADFQKFDNYGNVLNYIEQEADTVLFDYDISLNNSVITNLRDSYSQEKFDIIDFIEENSIITGLKISCMLKDNHTNANFIFSQVDSELAEVLNEKFSVSIVPDELPTEIFEDQTIQNLFKLKKENSIHVLSRNTSLKKHRMLNYLIFEKYTHKEINSMIGNTSKGEE